MLTLPFAAFLPVGLTCLGVLGVMCLMVSLVEILCSAKRLKLLMQPLSIHVKTEVLLLTKLEVWWYLVVRLGSNLAPNFEQVRCVSNLCVFLCDSSCQAGASVDLVYKAATAYSYNTSSGVQQSKMIVLFFSDPFVCLCR